MGRMLAVAGCALLAWSPALFADFLDLDDLRFVVENPAVHELTPVRYFTDPGTLSEQGWQGTWRPLRTLHFAIDWAVAGNRAWWFHLVNVLLHVGNSLLVLALLKRLGAGKGAATAGALFFAVHPASAEVVCWITSRGDLLLAAFFLTALLLHLKGRPFLALACLVLALFAKEAAVVFPAAAFLADRVRRIPPRWSSYGLYAWIVVLYVVLWKVQMGEMEHLAVWWGGSYGSNLAAMARGVVHYSGLLLLPVGQAIDYHVPVRSGLDAGAVAGILLLALAGLLAWRGGRRVRFAILWFGVTMLPTANLLFTIGIPTAERFLYLPLAGIALAAGTLLARTRLGFVVLGCLLVLAFSRAREWKDRETLFAAAREVATTPRGLFYEAVDAHEAMTDAYREGDRARVRELEAGVGAKTERYFAFCRDELGIPPGVNGGLLLAKRANSLLLVEKYEEALLTARSSLGHGGGNLAHYNAAFALIELGRDDEGLEELIAAHETGYRVTDLRPLITRNLNRIGRAREESGRRVEARETFERSIEIWPDRQKNAEAFQGRKRTR